MQPEKRPQRQGHRSKVQVVTVYSFLYFLGMGASGLKLHEVYSHDVEKLVNSLMLSDRSPYIFLSPWTRDKTCWDRPSTW